MKQPHFKDLDDNLYEALLIVSYCYYVLFICTLIILIYLKYSPSNNIIKLLTTNNWHTFILGLILILYAISYIVSLILLSISVTDKTNKLQIGIKVIIWLCIIICFFCLGIFVYIYINNNSDKSLIYIYIISNLILLCLITICLYLDYTKLVIFNRYPSQWDYIDKSIAFCIDLLIILPMICMIGMCAIIFIGIISYES